MPRRYTPDRYLPLDVNFCGNPKIIALTDGAFRLHLAGMLYCKRHRLDGVITAAVLPSLMLRYRPPHLNELLERMLWIQIAADYYQIHDWLDWNPSAAELAARSETNRNNAHRRWDTDDT